MKENDQVLERNVQVEPSKTDCLRQYKKPLPSTSCQISNTSCQIKYTSMNRSQEPKIKYTFKSHSGHIPKPNRRFVHQTLSSLATGVQLTSPYLNIIKFNSDSQDNNPYHCFFRSHYCQYYPNRIHTIF